MDDAKSGDLVDEVTLVHQGDVRRHHLVDELLEKDLGLPAELGLGLGGAADEQLDLRR